MNKCVKFFLILMLFVNGLFITIQDSSAHNFSSTVGPRDRIRNYKTNSVTKNVIEFKYSTSTGFSCYPDNLQYVKMDVFSSDSDSDNSSLINTLQNIGDTAATIGWELVVNILFAPLLCIGMLESLKTSATSSSSAKSLAAGIGALVIMFLSSGLERLESILFAEDDYNLDPTSPACKGLYIGTILACVIMYVVVKINMNFAYKILIILTVAKVMYIAKKITETVQYARAKKVFNRLSLCGDDWLTYGDNELMEELDDSGEFASTNDIDVEYIKKYFPAKGDFFGSYKYDLLNCFQRKDKDTCNKLLGGGITTTDLIDEYTTLTKKQYREYVYDGKEYAYSGCEDPRPERQYYSGVNDAKSQLYYFKGSEAANFACDRFLSRTTEEYREAYRCCIEASQKLICISSKNRKPTSGDASTIETYVMCNKNSSAGSCSIKIGDLSCVDKSKNNNCGKDNNLPCCESEDKTDYCAELEGSIDKATKIAGDINSNDDTSSNSNNSSVSTILTNQYNEYCKDGKSNVNTSLNFSETAIDAQKLGNKGTKVTFRIKQSEYNGNKWCVETYNLCPYNFRLLGGSEQMSDQFFSTYDTGYSVTYNSDDDKYYEKTKISKITELNTEDNCTFDSEGNRSCNGVCFDGDEVSACYNKPANFCQLDRHCVLIPDFLEKEVKDASPYIDTACINFVGSSHNFLNYINHPNADRTRLLSAPFVECAVETFKNMLLNKAGHTKCVANAGSGFVYDTCPTGTVYKKGEDLNENTYPSPFKTLKNYFSRIVKVLLVLSVVLYGFNVIIIQNRITREEITKMILSIAAVSYFSLSNNWMPYVFNGIYTTMNTVSNFAMSIAITDTNNNVGYDNDKYSGCYFFKHDEIPNNYDDYGNRKYLAIFDTLDCKLSRYFGFDSETFTNPPILSYFISGIFSFGFTLILILPFILVVMSLLFFTFKMAYVFIVNSLKMTLLLFVSPIMIPLYLFGKTRGMFNSWIQKIFTTIFAPVFVVMSLALFLLIFDKYFVGEARFYGTKEPIRDVYCGTICKISDTNFYYITGKSTSESYKNAVKECNKRPDASVVNIKEKSPICTAMFNTNIKNSGSTLFDFVISGFAGFPSVFVSASSAFTMFLDMIFLLVIIFIFDHFTGYLGEMEGIFGGGGSSGDMRDGPNLQNFLGKVTGAMTSISNKGLKVMGTAFNTSVNQIDKAIDNGRDKKAFANRDSDVGGKGEADDGGNKDEGDGGSNKSEADGKKDKDTQNSETSKK